jgi:hypothetical protein
MDQMESHKYIDECGICSELFCASSQLATHLLYQLLCDFYGTNQYSKSRQKVVNFLKARRSLLFCHHRGV